MSRMSALLPDDKKWVDSLIEGASINGIEPAVTALTDDVYPDIERMAERGDLQAQRVVSALARDGVRGRVQAWLKSDVSVVRLSRTGQIISVPARMGVHAVNDDGLAERRFQQPLWWELTWERFEAMVSSIVARRDVMTTQVEAFTDVVALRDKYPHTRTPLEACEIANIDPRSFDISEAV